jgi:PAT family beta-lactamase induction signal transducer AmpG
MPGAMPRLPALVMGLTNLPYGAYGAVTLITVPQLLAAQHVPEPMIAAITAAAMIPSVFGFLLAPFLDVRFNRRSYALAFGVLAAVAAFLALNRLNDLSQLCALMIGGYLAATLFNSALGGWLGSIVPAEQAGRLAAGFTIGNVAGFGIGAILFITILRLFPGSLGAAMVGTAVALPLLLLPLIPVSDSERRGVHESFVTLARDLRNLTRQSSVIRALLFFALPASSFALTNTLGGLGADFRASESFVALVAGIGSTVAGIVGSLLIPKLIDRLAPRITYLAIGSFGAVFTLSILGLPKTPIVFAIALIGQNLFQAAAFVVESTLIFRSIGENNPLAATQYAFLFAATCLPITYMQAVDGWAYGGGGLARMLTADAGLSLLACAILLALIVKWRRGEAKALLFTSGAVAHGVQTGEVQWRPASGPDISIAAASVAEL